MISPQMIEEIKKMVRLVTNTGLFPNGVYRNTFKFYAIEDPVGFFFYYHAEANFGLNEERF